MKQSLLSNRRINMWPHTVAILIGGQSKRMGSPKHLVTLPSGQSMLETMIAFAKKIATTTVIVGGEVEGICSVLDRRTLHGPVAGIEALLASEIDSQYLVVGCDMPYLQPIHVEPLLECNGNAVFTFEKHTLGLPLKIHTDELVHCTAYLDSGRKSIRGFIGELTHTTIVLPSEFRNSVTSLNSKEEISKSFGDNR